MSTFDSLVADLSRDVHRAQPKDTLQFCANWFQSRLEEQRARLRDSLARRPSVTFSDVPDDLYSDTPLGSNNVPSVSPFSTAHRHSYPLQQRPSIHAKSSPFGTLNVPGNALLANTHAPPPPPTFQVDPVELSPTQTAGFSPNHMPFDLSPPNLHQNDYLGTPSATILARRVSVSAESIAVDVDSNEPLPVYSKTHEQLSRIKSSIFNNFIFRDLDEEQEKGVLNAMEEIKVPTGEVVIRQGDAGEYFYVVESGMLHVFINSEAPPPPGATNGNADKFVPPGHHAQYGRKVAECPPGTSFGELALMYGHPRAATVLSMEPSTLWRVDRITFRTIILKAAHRRRTMYEQFLTSVPLLSSLSPEERSKIADALTSKVYQDGENVVKQGDPGDTFFFVEDGEAIVTKSEGGTETKVGQLRKGEYFGGTLADFSYRCFNR